VLRRKIENRTAQTGVVGLGYVGLPLAVELAHAGFSVNGIDIDQSKVDSLNRGESYIQDVPTSVLKPLVEKGLIKATTDFAAVTGLDTINICVPTPLRKTKDPDMSYIVSSCKSIANYFHAGMLVILESTTYPGTTDELMLPMSCSKGMT
jgi:UDP-N-acetyl-D-glucosamine dehydrogenase